MTDQNKLYPVSMNVKGHTSAWDTVLQDAFVRRHDSALKEKIDNYLSEKCVKRAFQDDARPLYYAIRGIKTAMWKRVLKPELQRMAKDNNHYIEMQVENPGQEWVEFQFIELPADMPEEVKRQEPPLTDEELRAVRRLLKKDEDNGQR